MYCRTCNQHFLEAVGGRCPACGRTLVITARVASRAPASLPVGEALDAGPHAVLAPGGVPAGGLPAGGAQPHPPPGDDPTRTERLPAHPWAPGTRIASKYEVICLLGSGGFGTVYKVRHIFRKKYYALKTPHPQFLKDEIFRRRFEREIEAMERFVHPDAVMIRDCGVTEFSVPYYTMDFIDGESLRAVLERERQLSPDRAVRMVRRVLQVLEAAHEAGIIHRDIKPDNILLTRGAGSEQVKVLDFGVAKLLDLVGWSSITHEARVGTPRYMSPEQITGDPVDARSDLFSLGIIFYEMVTGEHPFARDHDPLRVAASILNRAPVCPRDLAPGIPRHVSETILWLLERKPRKRPGNAAAVLEALPDPREGKGGPRRGEEVKLKPFAGAPRAPVAGLVLKQVRSEGERRSFILLKERVSFGRGGGTEAVDLILRCLPCRSPELDPQNWRLNLTLSHLLGWLFPQGSSLVVEPDARAAGGIALNGVRSSRPVSIQAEHFHLSLGDRALELDGDRRLTGPDGRRFDLSLLAAGRPEGLRVPGYSGRRCAIDHVHLRRPENFPLHEYFLVYRQLPLGSAADAGLRLNEEGVEEEHALLIHEGGELFLAPWEGVVRLSGPPAPGAGVPPPRSPRGDGVPPPRSPRGDGLREEITLPAGFLHPIVPGMEIILGAARLQVEALSPEWFKKA